MAETLDHRQLAEAVRRRVLEGEGVTSAAQRQQAAGEAAAAPFGGHSGEIAGQIGSAAYRVTDAQVEKLVREAGGQKGAFEIIIAAALGAGMHRWQRALAALDGA